MFDQAAGRTHRLIASIEDLRTLRTKILNWLESNDVSNIDYILFTYIIEQINDTISNYSSIARGHGFDVREFRVSNKGFR